MPPDLEEVGQWLNKAMHDQTVGRLALGHEPSVTDAAAFHAQQAAEKLLKAYLLFREVPFEKIHDLEELIDQCIPLDSTFVTLRDRVGALTPYAVRFRYPGPSDPSVVQAREALDTADALAQFLRARMPMEVWSAGSERTHLEKDDST